MYIYVEVSQFGLTFHIYINTVVKLVKQSNPKEHSIFFGAILLYISQFFKTIMIISGTPFYGNNMDCKLNMFSVNSWDSDQR